MISWKEMKIIEKNSELYGITQEILMENAGKRVAEFVKSLNPLRILVLCGHGNNGGDGYVAARYLKESGLEVKVYVVKEPSSPLAIKNMRKISEELIVNTLELEKYDVIVDAMLGTGLKPPLKEPYRDIVEKINREYSGIVVSVDVPTGIGTDCQIRADYTVTFHKIKEGMNENICGKIIVADIGIPAEAEIYTGPGELLLYPIPPPDSKKGDRGIVTVIGGGPYVGAPVLSALAAYRTGCDLVHVITSERIYGVVASFSPSLIVHPLFDKFEDYDYSLPKCNAVLIGPGLGFSESIRDKIIEFLKTCELPLVIDADAIKALKNNLKVISGKRVVITPHRGEFKYISDMEPNVKNAEKIAEEHSITILLKAPVDIITDGKRTKLNRTGNAAMSVGGTGDVLAGIVAALLSKGLDPFDAARLAAYMSGRAGDLAYKEKFLGLLPMDVVEKIPKVLKEVISLE